MAQLYEDFLSGLLVGEIDHDDTTAQSAGFAGLPVVASPDFLKLVLDPEAVGGPPEVVYVTAHSSGSTTATLQRGREGTTGRAHDAQTPWVLALTSGDAKRWDAYAGDISALQDDVSDLELATDALGGRIGDVEGDVADLQSDVSGELSLLGGRVTDLEGDVSSLQGDVSGLEGRVSDLESATVDTSDLVDGAVTAPKLSLPSVRFLGTGPFMTVDPASPSPIEWDVIDNSDPDGYLTGTYMITVPAGMGGLYACTLYLRSQSNPSGVPLGRLSIFHEAEAAEEAYFPLWDKRGSTIGAPYHGWVSVTLRLLDGAQLYAAGGTGVAYARLEIVRLSS